MAGVLLMNRVIWLGAAFVLLGAAWLLFRRERRATRLVRWAADAEPVAEPAAPGRGLPQARDGAGTAWRQLAALARFDMTAIFRSPAFFVLLGLGFFNSIGALWFASDLYGNNFHPVTRLMIQTLGGTFSLIPLIVSIYYAGELVWRDRDERLHEMVDASAAPDWAFVVAQDRRNRAGAVRDGGGVRAGRGWRFKRRGARCGSNSPSYLAWYVWPQSIDAVRFAVFAVFVQVLVPHKFLGWLVVLIVIVAQTVLGQLGYEHNLFQYAGVGEHSAVRPERPGALRDAAPLAGDLLERLRGAAAGARVRPVAPRCFCPATCPHPAAAAPPFRHSGDACRCRRRRVRGGRRLRPLQHQRSEPVPHATGRRSLDGGLREDAARVRERCRNRASSMSSCASICILADRRRSTTGALHAREPHRRAAE